MKKISKTKSWFSERVINKIDKPLASLPRRKEKTQINKIRNKKGDITADISEIQKTIREFCEQLYAKNSTA